MDFVHLHVHSEYSLLDGACRIRDLVTQVKNLGQTSVAVTDHGAMYGAINFYKAAVAAGIKPIIGCEVYVAARTRFDMDYDIDSERHHLVLLCKNEIGYKNLCFLVSSSFTEGFYIKPRVDMELLQSYSEGLIALSACTGGEIPKQILVDNYAGAKNKALQYQEIFGVGNFYLELQNHNLPEQAKVNEGLIKLSADTGIPLVATNDVHYIDRSGAEVQDILMCIQTGKNVEDKNRMRFDSSELFLKSSAEMKALFPEHIEAIENTVKIADMCNISFEFDKHHLPVFELPKGETDSTEYLRRLCHEGFEHKYGETGDGSLSYLPLDKTENRPLSHALSHEIRARLDYELDMIINMGFADYFLITADFISYAKSRAIPVGPGRGSAAGSVVSYCLDITTVDPIKYNLFFERFLNPERISMPDIDIDFCERRRGEVIEYVKQKYGADRVAQIITFNTLKAKNAVRSVSKALALTFQEENELAAAIPNTLGIRLSDALKPPSKLNDLYNADPRFKNVIDTAMALEDMPKDSGTHAAGVVITKNPVREYVPLALSKKDDSIATQYTMGTLEELGLLKMDFLGLRNLTIIEDAVQEIRKTNPDFSIESIPEDDEPTFAMLSAGLTSGVFQLESQGMTAVCAGLGPKSIEDITAIIALYRPGPMDSIPRFLDWSRNPDKITYAHPMLEPILNVTYGCIVYQEQVIEIFRKVAGFSLGQADMIRRAMSKKIRKVIDREKEAFIEGDAERGICGAMANGLTKAVASGIYDDIYAFADYAFPKAHAAAYAIISYQTAYLKCHFPQIYMAALLSSILGNRDMVAEYTESCRMMGISLLPPCINESGANFAVSGDDLRYGLCAVKNIGRGFINALVIERDKSGRFLSFEDFCRRMHGNELNKRAVESLIKCGCFDELGANRAQLIDIHQVVLDGIANDRRRNVEGQLDMFAMSQEVDVSSTSYSPIIELPDIEEFPKKELMRMEREVTGLYLSGHPMDEYRDILKKTGAVNIGEILADFARETGNIKFTDNQKITVAGVIESMRTKMTRNNSTMAYIQLDDGFGSIELLAFQRVIDESGKYMTADNAVLVSGRLSARDEKEPQIVVDTLRLIDETGETGDGSLSYLPLDKTENRPLSRRQTLYVKIDNENSEAHDYVKITHKNFLGYEDMIIHFADTGKTIKGTCEMSDTFVAHLKEIVGAENVVVK